MGAGWPFHAESARFAKLAGQGCRGHAQLYEHVKANDGNAMNELADTIAKLAAAGHLRGYAPPAEVVRLITEEGLTWLAPALDLSQKGGAAIPDE